MYRLLLTIISLLFLISCKESTTRNIASYEHTNDLINETSPYLLQHAHNPVDWKAWSQESLDLAKKENKLVIVSVGYSACHWCHVMERESFENDSVARMMNDNFINIKVDRQERPDIDQVYMSAVELITGKAGGWPLNCIILPDGRPIFGGTYFQKNEWINILNQLSNLYKKNPEKVIDFAEKLTKGLYENELVLLNKEEVAFDINTINKAVENWTDLMDMEFGGNKGNQKFPNPNNAHFLLRYGIQNQNKEIIDYTFTTLNKMAFGGIFDHVGGGFSRYSIDSNWHIPHFEKMLYDNGQLVSLYSDAYLITKNNLYKDIIEETLDFVERELTSDDGSFYSSLDADSKTIEGQLKEGEYYKWTKEELKEIIKTDFDIFQDYFNINSYGQWEKENYILIRNKSNQEIAKIYNLTVSEVKFKVKKWKIILLEARSKRIRPRLDDIALTSWNALMLKGYIDAYRVLDEPHYLKIALKNAEFIISNQLREDGGLNHSYKDGKSTTSGYFEDYANTIDAFINLYEVSLEEKWLIIAKQLTEYSFDHFYDNISAMFFFTSNKNEKLIVRKIEIYDKAIPSSNSVMANNLFKLSHYYSNSDYLATSKKMLYNVMHNLEKNPTSYSNWLQLMINFSSNYYEVAVSGVDALDKIKEINQVYIPNKLIAGSIGISNLPLMEGRHSNDKETVIYVCVDGSCRQPETNVENAIKMIK